MKKIKYVFMLSAAFIFAACGDSSSNGAASETSGGNSADTTHQVEAGEAHEHSHEGHSHSTFYTCVDHQDVHKNKTNQY